MSRSLIALTTLFFLMAGRAADLTVTFHFNPSLSEEGNPIVAFFGGGTVSLISLSIVIFALSAGGLLAFWFGGSLNTDPVSFRQFVSIWFRRVALNRRPFKDYFPGGSHANEGLQAFRLFGLVLSWALIFGSFTAVHAWFATRDTSGPTTYQAVYSFLRIGRYNYLSNIAAFVGCLFGLLLFFIIEYKALARGSIRGGSR